MSSVVASELSDHALLTEFIKKTGWSEATSDISRGWDLVTRDQAKCVFTTPSIYASHFPEFYALFYAPFGLNPLEYYFWYIKHGRTIKGKIEKKYDIRVLVCGIHPSPPFGIWRTPPTIESIKGLRFRLPGLGGNVLESLGGLSVTKTSNSMELQKMWNRGELDMIEKGPFRFEIDDAYSVSGSTILYPGWQEPAQVTAFIFKHKVWKSLPQNVRADLKKFSQKMNTELVYYGSAKELRSRELHPSKIHICDPIFLSTLRKNWEILRQELEEKHPVVQPIFQSLYSAKRDLSVASGLNGLS